MREQLEQELDIKRKRLQAYYDREQQILSASGVKSYTIGSQSLSRFDTELKDIQSAIRQLEQEIKRLEQQLSGKSANRAVGVVIRDW